MYVRSLLAIGMCAVIAAAALVAEAADPTIEVGFEGSYCGLRTHPVQQSETLPATLHYVVDRGNGIKAYEYGCGLIDGFLWGPSGPQQNFGASSGVIGFGEVGPGYIRAYGEAFANISPREYRPPGFIYGNNPYYAVAAHIGGAGFVETFTPPPTAQAPNPGDDTTMDLSVSLHCAEQANYLNLYTDTTIGAWVFTPGGFAQNPMFGYYDSVFARTDVVHGALHAICNFTIPKQVAVKVGQPVVVRMAIGILASGGTVAYASGNTNWDQWSDALNTATLEASDADGQPLTGASGHVYAALTLASYTTTTSTTSTSTTLAPGAATCGDGDVDPGEDCDCPSTTDPVEQGQGCMGASVIPPQESCIQCRQCHLLDTLCADVTAPTTTTTTTAPGATTTTTTTAPGATTTMTTTAPGATTTTSTTLPGACAGLTDIPRATCLLDAALAAPLCGDEPLPPKVDARLRGKLGSAAKLLANARGKSGKALGRSSSGPGARSTPPRPARPRRQRRRARRSRSPGPAPRLSRGW